MNERGKQAEDEIHKSLPNKEKTLSERKSGSFTYVRSLIKIEMDHIFSGDERFVSTSGPII